jgi:hypothetical protein
MEFVKNNKKNMLNNKFREIDNLIINIDSFNKYSFYQTDNIKNQLFIKDIPPFILVNDIINCILNKELNDNIYYEFSKKILKNKNAIQKIIPYIEELKKYYLKCKHEKYLNNLNEKKIITLFRQILKPYDYSLKSYEKYENGQKYLLYIIEKKKKINIKKISSVINFD